MHHAFHRNAVDVGIIIAYSRHGIVTGDPALARHAFQPQHAPLQCRNRAVK